MIFRVFVIEAKCVYCNLTVVLSKKRNKTTIMILDWGVGKSFPHVRGVSGLSVYIWVPMHTSEM